MKSPLLASLLLVNFYLDAEVSKKEQTADKKQKSSKRTFTKKIKVPAGPVELTSSNITTTLANKLTIVMVGADWCKWCGLMAPIFAESYDALKNSAQYASLSLGQHFNDQASLVHQLQTAYGVESIGVIPSFLVFENGKCTELVKGSQTKEQLAALIKKHSQSLQKPEPAKPPVTA